MSERSDISVTGIVLASASPRRRDLLGQIHVPVVDIRPADIDETPRDRELPRSLAERLAVGKAKFCFDTLDKPVPVLGADTVVAVGRRVLPKAEDEETARRCLALLSGRRHRVFGGVALILADGSSRIRVVETAVTFKRLDAEEVDTYIDSGEWHGKAGGYAIQGLAGAFVRQLNGSYSNVVGLPLFETANLLKSIGLYPAKGR